MSSPYDHLDKTTLDNKRHYWTACKPEFKGNNMQSKEEVYVSPRSLTLQLEY